MGSIAMESFEKILVGLLVFVVTSIVAYLFRMRQLYVSSPKLFRHAHISSSGSLCELIIYNKGNQVEENILIELDPDLKGELLASSSSDTSFEKSIMKIERLHKDQEASAILLIDNGVLDTTKIISISSKGTKGRVIKKVSDVPQNFAKSFIILILFLSIFSGTQYLYKAYRVINNQYVEYKLKGIYKLGWSNLSDYYHSDLSKSYSNQEFPINFIGPQVLENNTPVLIFEVYNKTASPLEVMVNMANMAPEDLMFYERVSLQPMTKQRITIPSPKGRYSNPDVLGFRLTWNNEVLYSLVYAPAYELF